MPKRLERVLAHAATARHLTGARRNAYIYGALRKMGWKPQRERRKRASARKRRR